MRDSGQQFDKWFFFIIIFINLGSGFFVVKGACPHSRPSNLFLLQQLVWSGPITIKGLYFLFCLHTGSQTRPDQTKGCYLLERMICQAECVWMRVGALGRLYYGGLRFCVGVLFIAHRLWGHVYSQLPTSSLVLSKDRRQWPIVWSSDVFIKV